MKHFTCPLDLLDSRNSKTVFALLTWKRDKVRVVGFTCVEVIYLDAVFDYSVNSLFKIIITFIFIFFCLGFLCRCGCIFFVGCNSVVSITHPIPKH